MSQNEKLLRVDDDSQAPRTKRLNKVPMLIFAGAVLAFLLMMVWVAFKRANQSEEYERENVKLQSSQVHANALAGDGHGIIPPDLTTIIPEDSPPPPAELSREEQISIPVATLDVPPSPPSRTQPGLYDDELNRLRMLRLQQLQEAIDSKVTGDVADLGTMRSSSGANPQTREGMLNRIAETRQQINTMSSTDPSQAYKMRLESMRSAGLLSYHDSNDESPPAAASFISAGGQNSGKSISSFDGQEDRWSLNSSLKYPKPYTLIAGSSVIPATLLSGINSDLPGQVHAQVSCDVYDTATGKYLLIPQGTRLVGSYSSDVAYGQDRVLMAWQRLIFPDGRSLDIGAMPGADSAGYAGFTDQVNHHYLRTFLSATLLSGVIAAVNISQDRGTGNSDRSTRSSDALSDALGQTLGQAVGQMISKNLNISPTIEIRPGYRLNVMVAKDLIFSQPYKAFSY